MLPYDTLRDVMVCYVVFSYVMLYCFFFNLITFVYFLSTYFFIRFHYNIPCFRCCCFFCCKGTQDDEAPVQQDQLEDVMNEEGRYI